MTAPSWTMTAPTGTSPFAAASRVWSSAVRMCAISSADIPVWRYVRLGRPGPALEGDLSAVPDGRDDVIARGELPLQNGHRQRVLQHALNRALERERPLIRMDYLGSATLH